MIAEGTILQDRYLVAKQIGAGGMGAVYVGTDQRFGSTVAIKETFFSDENLTRAFEREARLLNSLRHPALPRVSDHFVDGEGQFLVMEYIPGEDLSEMMSKRGEAFSVSEVMTWGDQLLDALDFLHTQEMPVVHRDIKPQNLKLTPRGQIILLDFGLAKGNPADSGHQTNTKSIFGYSRVYAPLEQIQGTGTDPRSDLYSLAATLYHLMAGVPPEDALTRATAVLNGNADPLRPASSVRPEISAPISEVLMSTMALNANFRPSSAAAMRAVLADAKNNISPASAEEVTLVGAPAAAIFDQKTQVIGGENTIAAAAVPPATEQNQATRLEGAEAAPGAIQIPVPAMEASGSRAFSSASYGGGGQKKRSRAWMGLSAAAAAVLLAAGCAAVIYSYNPGIFHPNSEPANSSGGSGGSEVGVPVNSNEQIPETHSAAGAAGGESKEPAVKNAEAKSGRETPVTKAEPNSAPAKAEGDGENIVIDDDPETAAEAAKTAAEQKKLEKTIRNMVQRRLKQANVKNKEVDKELDEEFGPPQPGNPAYVPRQNLPRRKQVIIRRKRP